MIAHDRTLPDQYLPFAGQPHHCCADAESGQRTRKRESSLIGSVDEKVIVDVIAYRIRFR